MPNGTPHHVVINLTLDANGDPIAEPQGGDDCHAADPQAACAWKSFNVTWQAQPPTRHWVVFFPAGTPFVNGKNTFTEKSPGGRVSATGSEWKYWILYVDDNGAVKHSDPKLVIQPSRALTAVEYGEWMNEGIDAVDGKLEELRSIVDDMSHTLSSAQG